MAVLIDNQQKKIKIDRRRVRTVMGKLLKSLKCPDKEISLLFVDDERMRELNKYYLNRDYPTNVIAFSMLEGKFGNINPSILGDIIISVETVQRDACKEGLEFVDGFDFLLIHGLLHLLGYDHENTPDLETASMKKMEKQLFFLLKGYQFE